MLKMIGALLGVGCLYWVTCVWPITIVDGEPRPLIYTTQPEPYFVPDEKLQIVFEDIVEWEPGSYYLPVNLWVLETFPSGFPASGYNWSDEFREFLSADLEKRIVFDPEAGMVSLSGKDREALELARQELTAALIEKYGKK